MRQVSWIYQLFGKVLRVFQILMNIYGIFSPSEKDLMPLHDGIKISWIYHLLGKISEICQFLGKISGIYQLR
jgi:hypothetical protein